MGVTISNCICPECGKQFPIPRQQGAKRPKGHHKRIFCPYCLKVTNMYEVRDEDFTMRFV